MTTTSPSATSLARNRELRRSLDPARGILVSLALGAAAWSLIAALALGLSQLL